MWNAHDGMFMFPGFGIFVLIIFVVVILLILGKRGKSCSSGGSDTPLDILKKRYAKGEITKEEFEERKRDLNNA